MVKRGHGRRSGSDGSNTEDIRSRDGHTTKMQQVLSRDRDKPSGPLLPRRMLGGWEIRNDAIQKELMGNISVVVAKR